MIFCQCKGAYILLLPVRVWDSCRMVKVSKKSESQEKENYSNEHHIQLQIVISLLRSWSHISLIQNHMGIISNSWSCWMVTEMLRYCMYDEFLNSLDIYICVSDIHLIYRKLELDCSLGTWCFNIFVTLL